MLKVKMLPRSSHFRTEESGIKQVVLAYEKYLPDYDIKLVDENATSYDVVASHAGMGEGVADVAHLHGLYWTADYEAPLWEYDANKRIVKDLRVASQVTVPSEWVAETIRRDMRLNPHVIGHGIDWQEWQHDYETLKYVLWNKNRNGDVCSPADIVRLSTIFPHIRFVSTFGNGFEAKKTELNEILFRLINENNFVITGLRPHAEMKRLVQQAGIYLSTTKETFGIGILEAMASGVPVLGYNVGGNTELVQHGVNGYLAQNFDDLCDGLAYCIEHHKILSKNSRELAKQWTWQRQIKKVAGVYRLAAVKESPTVSVIIPVYNKSQEELKRAIDSCLNQTLKPNEIIVIDDGSTNRLGLIGSSYGYPTVKYITQNNQGVANARNNGIALSSSKYVCCLDADDWLAPEYLETCVKTLESDSSLSIVYTGLQWHKPDGTTGLSEWPGEWNYDKQLKRQNQIPTCCVFTREMWQRLGGYRQRYAPQGAGSEDAEFWTRAGAYGFKAEKATDGGLFHYSWMSGQVTGNPDYHEVDWLAWHPWAKDKQHPFMSYATPQSLSHPVHQYDNPVISVIIPVGPGHEKDVINALDSLEAQTFRQWEAIAVFDTGNQYYPEIFEAYPYLKYAFTDKKGAGYARNRGVEMAKAPLLFFLDADDTLHFDALTYMLDAWNQEQKIIYSDYVGQAFIDEELALELQSKGRLQSYNPKDGEAIISYKAFPFDCERALRQPEDPSYIWCNISCLLPKVWHDEIGGFNEGMETWEDWDYWLRHVFNGKCFYHLERELLRYRFYTGQRREVAANDRQKAQNMILYLRDKYKDTKKMGCTSCGGNKKQTPVVSAEVKAATVSDDNYVKAKYSGSAGNHHIIGAYQMDFDPGVSSRRNGSKWKHYYGYKGKGHITLVHKEDIRLMVGKWEVIPEIKTPVIETVKPIPQPLQAPPPTIIKEDDTLDLQTVPGITDKIAVEMVRLGLTTKEAILANGKDGLLQIKGVADKRADMILGYLQKK